jgi:hypothetical protein
LIRIAAEGARMGLCSKSALLPANSEGTKRLNGSTAMSTLYNADKSAAVGRVSQLTAVVGATSVSGLGSPLTERSLRQPETDPLKLPGC